MFPPLIHFWVLTITALWSIIQGLKLCQPSLPLVAFFYQISGCVSTFFDNLSSLFTLFSTIFPVVTTDGFNVFLMSTQYLNLFSYPILPSSILLNCSCGEGMEVNRTWPKGVCVDFWTQPSSELYYHILHNQSIFMEKSTLISLHWIMADCRKDNWGQVAFVICLKVKILWGEVS